MRNIFFIYKSLQVCKFIAQTAAGKGYKLFLQCKSQTSLQVTPGLNALSVAMVKGLVCFIF